MKTVFTGEESIGEIVSDFPGASNLLKEYRIDFCCGGDRKLSSVLQEQSIGQAAFVERLNMLFMLAAEEQPPKDWRNETLGDLIAHIVYKHHAYLKEELPLLDEFIGKIVRVHGQRHPEIREMAQLFGLMKGELEEHLAAEENEVFPYIVQYGDTGSRSALQTALQAIGELEAEHGKVGDILKVMRFIASDYTLPPDACRTFTLTYQKLAQLESDLFEHIHLENNILFPRLERIG
ncbi:MAG TPA: iron-sulfur cluster repair di-iron protein [Paenibacillus sp.]|uniref:iron-sulfur cluster repair di-iron protein n=1 Tax=Paenibacillus sp. TaxID=58172 RepID=UPI0028D81684|nr:iron-sulfur cluster repair di-iron protein [Paenibacillus sp.]HUC91683.1 iron-sulfur cluster repair di-iron protein [Paenibacillus sp.]